MPRRRPWPTSGRPASCSRASPIATPMEESRWLSALVGGPVLLKCENLQRTGSFKIRGAYVRISRLSDGGAGPRRGRGVRRQPRAGRRARRPAARHQGDGVHARGRADPQGERHPRVRRRRGLPRRATSTTRWRRRRGSPSETGAVLIHPFDHVDIVAGQGTCGLEILEQAPDVETVLVPTGGGGLLAGHRDRDQGACAPTSAWSACRPRAPRRTPTSLAHGPPGRRSTSMTTMADGIAVGCPGDVPFAAIARRTSTRSSPSPRSRCRRALLAAARAGQDGRRAGRRGRRGRDARRPARRSRRRSSPCSPAATSTRCCWAR